MPTVHLLAVFLGVVSFFKS